MCEGRDNFYQCLVTNDGIGYITAESKPSIHPCHDWSKQQKLFDSSDNCLGIDLVRK
jgi:hypothetical protein